MEAKTLFLIAVELQRKLLLNVALTLFLTWVLVRRRLGKLRRASPWPKLVQRRALSPESFVAAATVRCVNLRQILAASEEEHVSNLTGSKHNVFSAMRNA